jgi:hypothetical protein
MQQPAHSGHLGEYRVGPVDPVPPSKSLRGGSDGQPNHIASNTLRWIVLAGAAWQLLSGKLPLGHAAYDQIRDIERIISPAGIAKLLG